MTIGSGIAVAAVWICAVTFIKDRRTTGIGAVVGLIAAVMATCAISGVK